MPAELYINSIYFDNDILPNAKNISYLATELEQFDLIPSTYTQQIGNVEKKNRFILKNEKGDFIVNFLDGKIDIVRVKQTLESDIGSLEDFCEKSIKIWQAINKQYSKTPNRLAAGVIETYIDLESKVSSDAFLKFNKPIDIYNLSNPITWDNNIMSRIDVVIGDKEEKLNIILEIKKMLGQINSVNSDVLEILRIKTDINTIAENSKPRFSDGDVDLFLKSFIVHNNEIIRKVQNTIMQ